MFFLIFLFSRPAKEKKLKKNETLVLLNDPEFVKLFGTAYLRWKALKNGEKVETNQSKNFIFALYYFLYK